MQDNNITDVEFKEVPTDTAAAPTADFFLPATYLINALAAAGHPAPNAWTLHIDPRVETAEEEKDRIFFANRALRVYLSEQESTDNISPRMLLAEGIPAAKWCALMDKGIVPWLMGLFDSKGQRIDQQKVEEVLAEEGVDAAPVEETAAQHPSAVGTFEGSLNLSEETKAKLRAFRDQSVHDHIRIDDRTFAKIHRNGQTAMEWYFNDGAVAYPLNTLELYSPAKTLEVEVDANNNFVDVKAVDSKDTATNEFSKEGDFLGETQESFVSSTEPTNLADKINAMAPVARGVNIMNAAPKNYELGIQDRSDTIVLGVDEAAAGTTDQTSVGGEILPPATFDEEEQLKGADEEAQVCCNQPTDCFQKEVPCMNRVEDGSMDSLPGSIKE